MSLERDTNRYETWLRSQCDVVEADLDYKHARMTESSFVFFRATFYRWARKIVDWCPELTNAPKVLAVGDAHTENFGTWRDAQGRLVWGLNDFDDAAVMPYAFDLVRLATSAILAPKPVLDPAAICAAVVHGYLRGLEQPQPALLDEQELWMRPFVLGTAKAYEQFWTEVDGYLPADPPRKVVAHFEASLPTNARHLRYAKRVAGGGGLGRPRFVVIAAWQGGRIVREAKAQVPSGWDWAHGRDGRMSAFMDMATGRFRSPDPFLETKGRFIFRRLAADSRKVELGPSAGKLLNADLIGAMARDLGTTHAATPHVRKRVRTDLGGRDAPWLEAAAVRVAAMIELEFADCLSGWRQRLRRRPEPAGFGAAMTR